MTASHDALDLLLALRPEDLDADELAAPIDAEHRAREEEADLALAGLIDAWRAEDLGAPSFSAADILARANEPVPLSPVSIDGSLAHSGEQERPTSPDMGHAGPTTGGSVPSWLVPVALAASIAAAAFGVWRMSAPTLLEEEGMRPKSLVSDVDASRVDLQFAVERADGTMIPGRNGAAYGPDASVAFRFDVQGEAGWVALLEVDSDGEWQMLYPMDGAPLEVEPGAHALASESGAPLVYRPDDPEAGTLEYVAVLLTEPVDPARVVPGLLSAGLHRADLWPRPVAAVDAVTVTWEQR